MKKNLLLLTFFLSIFSFAQLNNVVINEKLVTQVTKNQGIRLASNEKFTKLYEKQKKIYDTINVKLTQVVAIHDYIYKQLHNVNDAIRQGKQLVYMGKYLGEIGKNTPELLKWTAKRPQYAILLYSHYEYLVDRSNRLRIYVYNEILNEEKDFLMDSYDREYLIQQAYIEIKIINYTTLYIIDLLKRAHTKPYLYQIGNIGYYVNLDREIIKGIIQKYKWNF